MAEREVSVTARPEGLGHPLMHLPGPLGSGRGVHAPRLTLCWAWRTLRERLLAWHSKHVLAIGNFRLFLRGSLRA